MTDLAPAPSRPDLDDHEDDDHICCCRDLEGKHPLLCGRSSEGLTLAPPDAEVDLAKVCPVCRLAAEMERCPIFGTCMGPDGP